MNFPADVHTVEGVLDAKGLRFGIVVARFNSFITDRLLSGALDEIVRHGGSLADVTVVKVPGSFELALAARSLAKMGTVDAIIALGAVIRGATSHYDLVCGEAASALSRLGLELSIPVSFGVVTTDTVDQALERAGLKGGNRGADAVLVAIEMVQVLRKLEGKAK